MSLEAKQLRHHPIASRQVSIGSLVAAGPGEQRTQPQKPDVAHRRTLVFRHVHRALDRILGFCDVALGAPCSSSAGVVRARDAALISAVNRRRRASGSMVGSNTSGSAVPSKSSSSIRSCGSASGTRSRMRVRGRAVEVCHTDDRAQQARNRMERNIFGVGLAMSPHHLDPTIRRQRVRHGP